MKTRTFGIPLAGLCFLGALQASAFAVPVTINGYVTDLTGIPHDRPNITIRVRSVGSGEEIATGTSNADGAFSISIDPAKVPDEDVTLAITADGTAFIGGVETAVRTNATLFGLAGEIDSKLATRIPDSTKRVSQFIMLVVPKAKPRCAGHLKCRAYRKCRRRLFRSRR